jgi:acetoin utilization deacetylase AcuC-like enzyme
MIKIAWSACYNHPLQSGHRFPMEKYDLLPQQLIHEGTIAAEDIFEPEYFGLEVLKETHDPLYVERMQSGEVSSKEMCRIGFPYSPSLFEREVKIMHGTIQAALYALENGIAFNIAGGTHHAHYNFGEGFCIFNDIAIAANYLITNKYAARILVIDLDVHQGNGTASLLAGNKDVFTFSMHGKNNYPAKKENSTLDIALDDGITDSLYLSLLAQNLNIVFDSFRPDFIIYQCGVDILQSDKLGRMNISMNGIKERENIVLSLASRNAIPIVAVMGGGYSADIRNIIEAHATIYRIANNCYAWK